MKILYYELNELITEGRLLGSLINLSINSEALFSNISNYPFFKENGFNQHQLTHIGNGESGSQSSDAEIIPFARIQEYLQADAAPGKFAARMPKINDLLIRTSEKVGRFRSGGSIPPAGISANSLMVMIAFSYGLDALNIGAVFTQALPLPRQYSEESKLIEAVYEDVQARVAAPGSSETTISWVAAAMLCEVADFRVPPFRYLKKGNSPSEFGVDPLAVILGEVEEEERSIVLIQTSLDDMSPQILSHVINRLFEAGALDVYQAPIFMKKNRQGIQLNVVARQQDEAKLASMILKETTTLGVNVRTLDHRYHADVRMIEVETKYGSIPVKQKFLDGVIIQSKPEYEVMAKIASEAQISIDDLTYEIAVQLKNKNPLV